MCQAHRPGHTNMATELQSEQQNTLSEHSTNACQVMSQSEDQLSNVNENHVSTKELLNSSAQELIDEINLKRKRDSALLAEFKKAMDEQCSSAYNSVEMAMYNVYSLTNKPVEEKIQELFAVLERIDKLEVELEHFKGALSALYSDVHQPDVV